MINPFILPSPTELKGYNAKNKAGELKEIRKDAVKYTTHILTGSPDLMDKIENNSNLRKEWINANLEFIKKSLEKKTSFGLMSTETKKQCISTP